SKASYIPFNELTAVDPSEISYESVLEEYQDTLRIVASAEQQRYVLLGYSGAVTQISSQTLQVLQTVTATREVGTTQAQLARMLKIDPRSMFHFLKVLLEMKLIVKIPVTTDGQYTLLCLHVKFASLNPGYKAMNSEENYSSAGRLVVQDDGGRRFEGLLRSDTKKVSYYSGLIKQKLTHILARSKNQIMMVEDLAKALDLSDMNVVQNRWFNRQIELLCKLKYIKRVHAPGYYRCVQLLRLYGADTPVDEGEAVQLNLKSVIADDIPQSGICIDTSIEHQVYKHVLEAKEQGTIAKEIRRKMNMLNAKLLARILDTLSKPVPGSDKPLVNRVVEFVGRERRYRYYSEQGFKTSVVDDHKDYIEMAKTAPLARSGRKSKQSQAPTSSDTLAAETTVPSGLSQGNASAISGTAGSPDANAESNAASSDAAGGAEPEAIGANASGQDSSATNGARLQISEPALLSILERRRIVEFQSALVQEYQQEKARLYPAEKESGVIDRKTLYRTISILEAEGLLKVFKVHNIPMVGGGTMTKTFCLHHTVDSESEEVKTFVQECSDRHFLFGALAHKSLPKAETVDLEAETLDEMEQRLGQDFFKSPSVPLASVDAYRARDALKQMPKLLVRGGNETEGQAAAAEYGWNRAKMMRALAFHRFLLDRLGSADRNVFPYPSYPNVLMASSLFEVMPLRVFLIVVGIIQLPEGENRIYLDANRTSNIPLHSVPEHMRGIVAPNYHFKKRLREVLEVLDALGLVSPLDRAPGTPDNPALINYATNHLVLNTHYELHVNVRAPLNPIVPEKLEENLTDRKQYMLLSVKECKDFWMDLQSSASSMKYIPSERTTGRPWSEIRQIFLLNLCNRRLWADPIRITHAQREKLMVLVNKKMRYIPPAHDPKMDQMAKETGLPRDHVVHFYKAIKAAWHANPIAAPTAKSRLPRVGRNQRTLTKNEEELPSDSHADSATTSATPPAQESTISTAPATDISSHEQAVQNPENSLRELGGKYSVGRPKRTRNKKVLWTDADDERLLLTYAVLRCFADTFNVKFSWFAVAKAFHGKRDREICRHRFDKLMRETTLSKRVESYRAQFTHVMPHYTEKYEIDRNLKTFDPSAILDDFRPGLDLPV
ncbi:hypothetical protein BGZ54_003451, partial [Gamsiella multidivaricata]